RKCANVQLVDNVVLDGKAEPSLVVPGEIMINNFGRRMDTFGLVSRNRIRKLLAVFKPIFVSGARPETFDDSSVITALLRLHRDDAVLWRKNVKLDSFMQRRPEPEPATAPLR